MHTIISTWTDIIQQFFPIFTAPGAQIFYHLMTGWILCTTRKTITGIIPFADPTFQRAHDAYHRFFPDSRWDVNGLWQVLTLMLVKLFCPAGIITFALDDTLFHHSGRKINGASYWRDAVRSTKKNIVYAWGLNLVVLTLQIQPPWGGEPLGLPINMRLHRKNGPTLIELAMQMINQIHQWLPERRFRLVADGFYATLAGKQMPKTHLVSRIQRNAKIFDIWYNRWRPHMTLEGLRPNDVYDGNKPDKPGRNNKSVPSNIERHYFRSTRTTSYRLNNVA